MKIIAKITFGAHLYGTATATSDLDLKAVYLPSARDILLQQVQATWSNSRTKTRGEKNTAGDIDYEAYSLKKFLSMFAEGKMVALDILFAPKSAMTEQPLPLWDEIKKLAPHLFNKNSPSFIKYCQQQANKYSIKASRIIAARQVLDLLLSAEKRYGPSAKLACISDEFKVLAAYNNLLAITEIAQPQGISQLYFIICGKKVPANASIKLACEMTQGILKEFGERSLASVDNKGIDLKALSHAVRIAHEGIEFLSSHTLSFPRPEAQYLLAIKQGKLSFNEVAEEIERLFEQLNHALESSTLPQHYDQKLIEDFIESIHRDIVINETL